MRVQEDKDWLDLKGRVAETPTLDVTSDFPKMNVILKNGNMMQTIDFLGDHSTISLKKNDLLCVGGARVNVWHHKRRIQTSYLTVVEVNPSPRAGLDLTLASEEKGPKRKATRMTPKTRTKRMCVN